MKKKIYRKPKITQKKVKTNFFFTPHGFIDEYNMHGQGPLAASGSISGGASGGSGGTAA